MAKRGKIVGGPGSLKDGWNMIARDLDRAIALASLGPNETLILQVAREGCWVIPSSRKKDEGGRPKEAVPCRINISALARLVGRHRECLSRAVTSLVASRLLVRAADGTLTIDKDYTRWLSVDPSTSTETPLFSEDQLRYIWAAKQLTTVQPICEFPDDAPVTETSRTCDSNITPPCDSNITPPVTETSRTCDSNITPPVMFESQSPIEDRARVLRVLERERVFLRGEEDKKNGSLSLPEKGTGIDWMEAARKTNEEHRSIR